MFTWQDHCMPRKSQIPNRPSVTATLAAGMVSATSAYVLTVLALPLWLAGLAVILLPIYLVVLGAALGVSVGLYEGLRERFYTRARSKGHLPSS
jgi:hypothetical protein